MYDNKMSHEYAKALQETAEYLLSKPDFMTGTSGPYIYLGTFYAKDEFLKAAKSLGNMKKEYTDIQLKMKQSLPQGAQLYFDIARDKVCRLVQEAKWECEPLMTPEEEASI
jgi:hypothetical protein